MGYNARQVDLGMYTAFYGLREKPFALTPDPRFLYLAEPHREAFAHLLYGIEQGEGFIAITGEVGTGKTTLCRSLIERLGPGTEIAFLFNPSCSGAELLAAIATEFGLEAKHASARELNDQLNRFLLTRKREGRRVLLIVDEAQNLSQATLEQVRLLSNLETSSEKLIQILLLGQPELDAKLDSNDLRQLRQRISVRWNLSPMSSQETREYVRHRIQVAAAAKRDIFGESALREIHRRTRGVPRLVNVLCDRLLLAGYANEQQRIEVSLVRQVAEEIPDTRRASGRGAGGRGQPGRLRRIALGLLGGGLVATCLAAALLEPRIRSAAERLLGDSASGPPDPAAAALEPDRSASHASAAEPDRSAVPAAVEPDGFAVPLAVGRLDPAESGRLAETTAGGSPERAEAPASAAAADGSAASQAMAPVVAAIPHRTVPPIAEAGLLEATLLSTDPSLARQHAVVSLLDSFGLEATGPPLRADQEIVLLLESRGLALLPLDRTRFDTLRNLNHPALLELRGGRGETRLVALRELDPFTGTLYGTGDGGPLRTPLGELDSLWTGRAWVVWRDFEPTEPLIRPGAGAASIRWLQEALTELGLFSGPATGSWDERTFVGVKTVQLARRLQPDGAVGPRTKMVLYDMLEAYAVPRLVRTEGSG